MQFTEIIEKPRKSYIDIQYQKLMPLGESLRNISTLTSEQVKAFEGAIKKLDTVSKKMAEAEAKLKLLGETSGKMTINGSDEVKELTEAIDAELKASAARSEHRKLLQIFLNGVTMKGLDEANKELSQNTQKLKTHAEEYAKQSENWVKNAFEAFTKKQVAEAKNTFEMAKQDAKPLVVPVPADYDKTIEEITNKM